MEALFRPFVFGADERTILDRDGHFALPGVLTDAACTQLTDGAGAHSGTAMG